MPARQLALKNSIVIGILKAQKVLPIVLVLGLALYMRVLFPTGVVRGDDVRYAKFAYTLLSENALDTNYWNVFIRLGLYTPVTLFYKMFGVSEFSTLIYPVLSSLLGIFFVYLIAKLLKNEAAGLIAALLWALFPLNLALSTQLLPDGVMTSYSLGAIYFFLLAQNSERPRARLYYFLCLLFLIWAVLIKITGLITAGFLLAFWLWKKVLSPWACTSGAHFKNRRMLLLLLPLIATVLYLSFQPGSTLNTLALTARDAYQTALWGTNPFVLGIRDEAFDVLLPISLIAISVLLVRRNPQVNFLLLWFGVQFLYAEWGSQLDIPYGFNLLDYAPLTHWIENRTTFFLTPPLFPIIGIYLSEGITEDAAKRLTIALTAFLGLVTFASRDLVLSHQEVFLQDSAFAVASLGFIASPYLLFKLEPRHSQWLVAALLTILALGEMRTFRGHPVERITEQSLMENLRQAATYLKASDPQYPITTYGTGYSRLDYASDFEFNYHDPDVLAAYQSPTRIIILSELAPDTNAYIVVRESGVQSGELNPAWWPLHVFGSGSPEPVYVYRQLSPPTAERELSLAKQALQSGINKGTLDRLIGAAVSAGDAEVLVENWYRWLGTAPDSIQLSAAKSLLVDYAEQYSTYPSTDLFAQITDEKSSALRASPPILLEISRALPLNALHLQATLQEKMEDDQFVSIVLQLKPKTLYFYRAEIRSTVPINVLEVNGGQIWDSADAEFVSGGWTSASAVFITPDSNQATLEVELRLAGFAPHNSGAIWLQNPTLIEVPMVP